MKTTSNHVKGLGINMTLKYITFDNGYHNDIVIFSEAMEHAQMFRNLNLNTGKVIGAGFVDLNSMKCYGKSVSIDFEATEQCTNILRSLAKSKDL